MPKGIYQRVPSRLRGSYAKTPLAVRFWAKVKKTDGCWLWRGAVHSDSFPYGLISRSGGGIPLRAHRVSWALHHGQIPPGLHVLHKCDNPRCVRPDHLFLGTPKDNSDDAKKKGRLVAWNEGKPRCRRGHLFAGDNLILANGKRVCRECRRLRDRLKKRELRRKAGKPEKGIRVFP